MIEARYSPYRLDFRFEAITSRQHMLHKDTYLVCLTDTDSGRTAVGECALFKGLSADDVPDYEQHLARLCAAPLTWRECTLPSLRFGFETAFRALAGEHPTSWSKGCAGIPINGLVWMGDKATMAERITEKIDAGFRVIKLKIGGIALDQEMELLADMRRRFSPSDLEIRLDANGSLDPATALRDLERLAIYDIHSIEQPVRAGLTDTMAELCRKSPIPIAIDEELIGYRSREDAAALLDDINPQYIILKPALIGGVEAADTYIDLAGSRGIGWWATSALESNVGLYAIASWLAAKNTTMPQGLGTGMLYSNNFTSPMYIHGAALWCRNSAFPFPENILWRN